MSTIQEQKKVVLITGANRGIGLELVKSYAARGYKVIAAVRDLSKAPKVDEVVSVKIDSESLTDAKDAITELEVKHKITHLDIVIANAGVLNETSKVSSIDPLKLDNHYNVNVRGVLLLFQATRELLQKSTSASASSEDKKKFVVISTFIGANSIDHWPLMSAYTMTKGAATYLARQIHFEEPWLISFSLSPGWVDTEMGQFGAEAHGMPAPPDKLVDILPGILTVIDGATKEETSGYMWSYDGTKCPW